MQIFKIFLDFPHYARLNKNFAKSLTMQIRTKQIRTKQGPTVLYNCLTKYVLCKWNTKKLCVECTY